MSTVSKNIFPLLIYNYISHIYVYIYLPMNTKQKIYQQTVREHVIDFFSFLQNKKNKFYLSILFESGDDTRVFIGFSFNPMLSGDSSSGEMHDGLNGLLGLPVNGLGL
ncbi:hypothetical protein Hanom_Chr10g00965111 [Helianthus anomalus]